MKLKSKFRRSLLSGSFFLFLFSLKAQAYPDLVRHGYASCTACHVSPTGGGTLTAYGRSLSKELLSTWSVEGEERWAYVASPPEWLNLGGDFRYIQIYKDTPSFTQEQAFWMQSDLEAAISNQKFFVDATVGTQDGPPDTTPDYGHFISRRHYAGYHPSDESSVRIGRFFPSYGINLPNHSVVTRMNLGFDEGNETDNVEASYIGDKADIFVTAIMGRLDDYNSPWRRGASLSASYFFLDRFKVGLSYMHTKVTAAATDMAGLWGILGFTKKLYMLSEFDMKWMQDLTGTQSSPRGCVTYQQLNYEFVQGLHVYLVQQLSYLDFTTASPDLESWGIGTQLFPRPHTDIELEYRKERTPLYSWYYDTGWLMLHYYL